MPDMMAHIFMGYDVLNALPDKNKFKKASQENLGIFNNGLQGSDPFFYSGTFPFGADSLTRIGNLLHKEKTGAFLTELIRALNRHGDCPGARTSLVAGLACHYFLDTTCHPYIYFFSGFDYSGSHPEYSVCHKKLEVILDMLLVNRMVKEAPRKVDRSAFIEISNEALCAYGDFSAQISNLYNISVSPDKCLKSLRQMKLALKLLHDPLGLKEPFLSLLDFLMRKRGLYKASIFDSRKIKSLDYANVANETWQHPVTGEELRYSFFDLYDNAVEKAAFALSEASNYLEGTAQDSDLCGLFPDLDYDTGLSGNASMRFHKCLFD